MAGAVCTLHHHRRQQDMEPQNDAAGEFLTAVLALLWSESWGRVLHMGAPGESTSALCVCVCARTTVRGTVITSRIP